MRRIVGKLNTVTNDGRMIKTLHEPTERIPVFAKNQHDLPIIVGTATWHLDEDFIVADIDLRYEGFEDWSGLEITKKEFKDLNAHMMLAVPQHHWEEGEDNAIGVYIVDVGILQSLFLDDQPDAFGDLK